MEEIFFTGDMYLRLWANEGEIWLYSQRECERRRRVLLQRDYGSDFSAIRQNGIIRYAYADTSDTVRVYELGGKMPVYAGGGLCNPLLVPGRESPLIVCREENGSGSLRVIDLQGNILYKSEENTETSGRCCYMKTPSGAVIAQQKGDGILVLTIDGDRPKARLFYPSEYTDKTIQNISRQYDDLTAVALQYKEEANKWYRRYLRKR